MDLKQHLMRQIAWSRETFGPGQRNEGVSDHILKELNEIAAETVPLAQAQEWVDVIILALDGIWRSLSAHPDLTDGVIVDVICRMIDEKQTKNETRKWPDWRTAEPGKAIEHVRGDE